MDSIEQTTENTSDDELTLAQRDAINKRLTEVITAGNFVPADKKFWDERKEKLDKFIKDKCK